MTRPCFNIMNLEAMVDLLMKTKGTWPIQDFFIYSNIILLRVMQAPRSADPTPSYCHQILQPNYSDRNLRLAKPFMLAVASMVTMTIPLLLFSNLRRCLPT